MEKNSCNITCSCEAGPPSILEPLLNREPREKYPKRTPPDRSVWKNYATLKKERITPRRYWTEQSIHLTFKYSTNLLTSLECPTENVGHRQQKGNPKERTGVLDIFPKGHGIGRNKLQKQNSNYGKIPAATEGKFKLYGMRSRLANKYRKGLL